MKQPFTFIRVTLLNHLPWFTAKPSLSTRCLYGILNFLVSLDYARSRGREARRVAGELFRDTFVVSACLAAVVQWTSQSLSSHPGQNRQQGSDRSRPLKTASNWDPTDCHSTAASSNLPAGASRRESHDGVVVCAWFKGLGKYTALPRQAQ